jgi:hypothetical protein
MDKAIEYDEVMQEIWRIKDDNAARYPTVAALFAHLSTVPWTGQVVQPRSVNFPPHTHPATPV